MYSKCDDCPYYDDCNGECYSEEGYPEEAWDDMSACAREADWDRLLSD